VIFGQKTLQYAKSALDRVNVRRLLIEIKRTIRNVALDLAFEQNDSPTRLEFVEAATQRLIFIQSQAGIKTFRVIMDGSNNSDEDERNNRINIWSID